MRPRDRLRVPGRLPAGTALTAIHAWRPADFDGLVDVAAAAERPVLDEALEGWRGKFPDVSVVPKLVRADPGHALVAESAGAALVVVGSRGRRGVLRTFAGSVSGQCFAGRRARWRWWSALARDD